MAGEFDPKVVGFYHNLLRPQVVRTERCPFQSIRNLHHTFTLAARQLHNYIAGQWIAGSGKQADLLDASTGELIATTSSSWLDSATCTSQGF